MDNNWGHGYIETDEVLKNDESELYVRDFNDTCTPERLIKDHTSYNVKRIDDKILDKLKSTYIGGNVNFNLNEEFVSDDVIAEIGEKYKKRGWKYADIHKVPNISQNPYANKVLYFVILEK